MSFTRSFSTAVAPALQRPMPMAPAFQARRRRSWLGPVREILIIAGAVCAYFLVRGLIDGRVGVAFENAEQVIGWERATGLFIEPDLQAAVLTQGWLVDALNTVYIYGHWPVIVLTLIWLVTRHPEEYVRFRNALLISGAIGLVIFATFPVAPPRFMADFGFIDTVTQQTEAYRVLQPPAFTNQYAAMPSLHFGWNLLIGIAWASLATNRWGKLFGWFTPIAMYAAIVLTANHYLIDGVVGGSLALFGFGVATWWHRRQRRTRSTVAPTGSAAELGLETIEEEPKTERPAVVA